MIRHHGCEIDIFHTGDGTAWCFEIRKDGRLIDESNANHDSEESCREDAMKFVLYQRL